MVLENLLIATHGLVNSLVPSSISSTTNSTGWFISIASFTLLFRVSLLPLVKLQLRNNQKIMSPIVQSQLSHLNKLYIKNVYRDQDAFVGNPAYVYESTKLYVRGFKGIMRLNNIKPIFSVILPFVQIPVFVSFVYAMRGMINSDNLFITQQLQNGGALWFNDLTIPDPYYILPVIAISSTYLSLELSLGSTNPIKDDQQQHQQQKKINKY
jgi:YidC/Oxa1 family membrane protein insertase